MARKELSQQKVLEEALYKKALGFEADEIVEEYAIEEDGSQRLIKRKVTKKRSSPDIPAAKVLLEHFLSKEQLQFSSMSDDELESEKQRLLSLLKKDDAGKENEE